MIMEKRYLERFKKKKKIYNSITKYKNWYWNWEVSKVFYSVLKFWK